MGKTQKQLSIGIDLHKTQFTVAALTDEGEFILQEQYPCDYSGYEAFASWAHEAEQKYEVKATLAIEATGNARFFKNYMENEGFEVKIINTLKFKVVVQSANKTDKRDARTIALFLSRDMLPESHLCAQYDEDLRRLLKCRSSFVTLIVGLKNNIHAMMLSYGIVTRAAQFQSKKGRQQLRNELEAHNDFNAMATDTLNCMLDSLETANAQKNKIEQLLESYIEEDEMATLLRTIPGVGLMTAASISAWVSTMDRFPNYKAFASYCGLVPYLRESNNSTFLGRITKRGPKELRTALVQTVMGMLRMRNKFPDLSIYEDYDRLKREKGSGKAIVACARKLSRVIFCMLKNQEAFDLNRMRTSPTEECLEVA